MIIVRKLQNRIENKGDGFIVNIMANKEVLLAILLLFFFFFFKLSTALLFPKLYNNIVQHLLKMFASEYNSSLIPTKSFPTEFFYTCKMHKVHKQYTESSSSYFQAGLWQSKSMHTNTNLFMDILRLNHYSPCILESNTLQGIFSFCL